MAENQIRVSFMITAPFLNENCSGIHYRPGPICESPGVAVELLYLITTYLNLTINKVKVIEHVTGIFGLLMKIRTSRMGKRT
jgi:hypothetical protein